VLPVSVLALGKVLVPEPEQVLVREQEPEPEQGLVRVPEPVRVPVLVLRKQQLIR